MHIIAQDVRALSDHELVFRSRGMFEHVVGLEQGAARHASVELAIGVAGRRRKDTIAHAQKGLSSVDGGGVGGMS